MNLAALAAQQAAMVQALWRDDPDAAWSGLVPWLAADAAGDARMRRGLRAYRSNGRALAQRALAAAYPVTARLLGEDNFGPLARLHWQDHPPVPGDIAQWGGALPGHIARIPDLIAAEPYLADLARLEWALHAAHAAADRPLDLPSFALLQTHAPEQLALRLAPGAALVSTDWPVLPLLGADGAAAPPSARAPGTALVWRDALHRPQVRPAQPDEIAFIDALLAGRDLAAALAAAPALDIGGWLAPAVRSGLLCAATPL